MTKNIYVRLGRATSNSVRYLWSQDWVILLKITTIFSSFTSLALMPLNGAYVSVRASSSNDYHFMTWLLRGSFLSTLLFSAPGGKEIISSHGTITVRPFPFPERRKKAIKNSLWVMVDQHPGNGVSPPMGAREGRSNKIIRKYIGQLSCGLLLLFL